MEMKGFVFSLDAIISLSVVILLVSSFLLIRYQTLLPEKKYEQLSYIASDAINVLAELKVYEIRDNPIVKNLIESGNLSEKDFDRSVLDLIGTLWVSGKPSEAESIAKEILKVYNHSCLRLEMENETIFSSCEEISGNIAISSRIESGIEIGKPAFGHIARAWARKVRKNTTEIVPFLPEGSGWTGNNLTVEKKFTLPTEITIYNATLWVSAHFGTIQELAQFENLKVNGKQKKNDVVWLYKKEQYIFGSGTTTAAYGYVDVTNEIVPGNNTILLEIRTPNYHSHIHPGMRLVVTYSLTQESKESEKIFRKRYYFDDVQGNTGSWAIASFFIPEHAKNISTRLHLNLKDVEDTFDRRGRNSSDILIYINSKYLFFNDSYCPNNEDCTPEFPVSIRGTKDVKLDFNITNVTINGTNVISVYVNCYGDNHWGRNKSRIYSDPINDPENSSYIEVYYELERPPYGYGEIDITREIIYGGNHSNPKEFNFTLNESQSKLLTTFTHIAQAFSWLVNISARNSTSSFKTVFTSPSPRAIPASVFIEPKIFSPGTNYLRIVDFLTGGSLSPANFILNYSSFEYTYLVKALVGYGNVFSTPEEAINDSIKRLENQLGTEGISYEEEVIENKTVQGIRYPWGPSLFKILVWEK